MNKVLVKFKYQKDSNRGCRGVYATRPVSPEKSCDALEQLPEAFRECLTTRQGLTLVELIAALALSAVLLVSTLGLATRLANNQNRLTTEFKYQPWKQRVANLMDADFRNCRSFLIDEQKSTISMMTCHSLGSEQPGKRQLPSLVTYQIESRDSQNYLIRTEQPLSGNRNQKTDRTVVCTGVRAIRPLSRIDSDYPPNTVTLNLVTQESSQWLVHLVRHGGF